ncbi:MAG TPA: hypothetical protein VLG11_01520 [Candidatus Saccharimonadales bacterium]|nr:hypothetical protein [Candidatus Saccharimonadales bacterium]
MSQEFERRGSGEIISPVLSDTQRQLLTDERTPFGIRGHHVRMFACLLLGRDEYHNRETPAQTASLDARAYRRQQIAAQNNPNASPNADYWSDFIGDTVLERRRHQKDSKAMLSRFDNLAPDHPVKFGAVQDEICRTCIIGDHCTDSSTRYSYQSPTRIQRDTREVNKFIQATEALGLSDQLVVIQEMTDYADRHPEPVPAALTTADVFKDVIYKTYDPYWGSFKVR